MDATYSYSYSYDPIGNRVAASEAGVPWTYTTNSLNQYTSATESNVQLDFAYDLVNVGWIKQILYWISIYRRFNTFYVGVFSVADFVFYLCVSAVFLFLTVRVLEKKRWS